jgi:CheY-like chemotaxis protein
MIDDEQPILSMLVQLFGSDHQVVTAISGEAAQVILRYDQSFDVILCDLMMPGLSGMDLHAWVATEYPALAARIVFVTGGAFTPTASEYIAGVRNLCVDKPYEKAKLKQLVSDLVVAVKTVHHSGLSN